MPEFTHAHALLIGIANYRHVTPLPNTVIEDVNEIGKTLIDPQICGYPRDNVILLTDMQATREGIQREMERLAARSNDQATVFFYLSAHGAQVTQGAHAGEYLLPVDTECTSSERLAATAISSQTLTTALRAIPARKMVVVFDCCHAGGLGPGLGIAKSLDAPQPDSAIKGGLPEHYYETLQQGRGSVILASSRSDEVSYIQNGAPHSLFTQHLLDGLRGGASGAGGVIRIFDLFHYMQPRVVQIEPRQHPIFKAEVEENFPVALYKGGHAPKAVVLPPPDDYTYDVFISTQDEVYAHYDGDTLIKCIPMEEKGVWLCRLLQKLSDTGLRAAGPFRAPLTLPKLLYAGKAIPQSRYVLLALSSSYLASAYQEYVSLIARHVGFEESCYRVIAVLQEACTPRLDLRVLPLLDMSTDRWFDLNVERLVIQLCVPV